MRLAMVFVCAVICCGTAAAQGSMVRMGLWEATIRTKATVPPEMTVAMMKNGLTSGPTLSIQTIDPPMTERWHTCMDEAKWRKNYERMKTAPRGCVFTHQSEGTNSLSLGLKCSADGMSIVMENRVSWTRMRIHLTLDSTTTYPGVAGVARNSTETTSLFLSPNCGSVAQGASVPAK
jgi:hypothetical protein